MLSIGIVGSSVEFYAELDAPSWAKVVRRARQRQFLHRAVLCQFGRLDGTQHSLEGIAHETARWLRSRGGDALEVAYDYSVDFSLLEDLLAMSDPSLLIRLSAVHIGYMLEDSCGETAAIANWCDSHETRGLQRHHALADALALKARFEAVHGL